MLKLPYKIEEGEKKRTLIVDANSLNEIPLIEDNPNIMDFAIRIMLVTGKVDTIIFQQGDDYEYDSPQTDYLWEISQVFHDLYFSFQQTFLLKHHPIVNSFYQRFHRIIYFYLTRDPIGAYVLLNRLKREVEIAVDKHEGPVKKELLVLLNYITTSLSSLEKTSLIQIVKPKLVGYRVGSREIYREIFRPFIKPNFMYVKLLTQLPTDAEIVDFYNLPSGSVYILQPQNSIRLIYHLIPKEFSLPPNLYYLISEARNYLLHYNPLQENLVKPENLRDIFYQLGRDLLIELANKHKIRLAKEDLRELASILVKYTAGFGVIETILEDKKIQDILINAPLGESPIFVTHEDYGEMKTNIKVTPREAEIWVTRLKLYSGRPLDSANPILDAEIELQNVRARVAALCKPLSPYGLAFAIRRHREKPWTLPLLIKYKEMNPKVAGLLSFMVEFGRTILIAGTRGSGKTSLLTALLLELPLTTRIITIEDVLEIPSSYIRKLGFDIQNLKVRSPLSLETRELPAEFGIRASLRLGDSALVLGEVRSKEAIALFEAMRVGAMANAVLGTIHAESPYGVFDRVVNDLGVPRTSFKAVDLIVMLNLVRSPSSAKFERRLIQLTEVRKYWESDPLREKAFYDLAVYEPSIDSQIINDITISEVLRNIVRRVKVFSKDWQLVLDYIDLKAWQKEMLVKYNIFEAEKVVKANDSFRFLVEKAFSEDKSFSWIKQEYLKILEKLSH